MSLSEEILRALLGEHPHLELIAKFFTTTLESHQRETEGLQVALKSKDETIAVLKQSLDLSMRGTSGGGGGGAAPIIVGGGWVKEGEAHDMARKAVDEYKLVASFDPFSRMHAVHSPTPSETSTTKSDRSPASSPSGNSRRARSL